MTRRPTHPLDGLLEHTRWRWLTAASLGVLAFGFGGTLVLLFDLDTLVHALTGAPWNRDWPEVRETIAPGLRLLAIGAAATAISLGMWGFSWWVHLAGGAYWYRRSGQARRLLRTRGQLDPAEHRLARAAMELEEREGGWRPETVIRFLESSLGDPAAPVERVWLDEIRGWSVALRVEADASLRSPGLVHVQEVGGVRYDAETVATCTEQIDRLLMDLRFRDREPLP